ncbi:hypothetical protein [Candidatus Harpocratesius sp.]
MTEAESKKTDLSINQNNKIWVHYYELLEREHDEFLKKKGLL